MGHHIYILTHCNSVKEALFYINRTIEGNWSRRMLEDKFAFYRFSAYICS